MHRISSRKMRAIHGLMGGFKTGVLTCQRRRTFFSLATERLDMMRFLIDYIAIAIAMTVVFCLTESLLAGFASGVLVGVYGFLCFADGVKSMGKKS